MPRDDKDAAAKVARQKPQGDGGRLPQRSSASFDENRTLRELSGAMGVAEVDLSKEAPRRELSMLPEDFCRSRVCVVFRCENGEVHVAMHDPLNIEISDSISKIITDPGLQITYYHAPIRDIEAFIERVYASEIDEETVETQDESDSLFDVGRRQEDEPATLLVRALLRSALSEGASDLYLEWGQNGLEIRLRVDGRCVPVQDAPARLADNVVSKLKVMSGMDISVKRLPQDGHFAVSRSGERFEMRSATFPTVWGENMTIRLLPSGRHSPTLEDLDMPENVLEGYRNFLRSQYGMLLVSGPTGSGKTTTLYAGLEAVTSPSKKVITIEDPVEYRLPGLSQMQVGGTSFLAGLRASLRQAPDVIMLGEVRDPETAGVACRAAMTGHIVMSTIHANSAVSTVARLVQMGVEPHIADAALLAVIAQRLVPKLCHCVVDGAENGCNDCRYTGERGRLGVYEFLRVRNRGVSWFVSTPEKEAVAALKEDGYRTMYDHGEERHRAGQISSDALDRLKDFG